MAHMILKVQIYNMTVFFGYGSGHRLHGSGTEATRSHESAALAALTISLSLTC